MTLADTIEQIKQVRESLKAAKSQAKSMDEEASNIVKRFKAASAGAEDLKQIFQKIGLPEGFSKAADLVARLGDSSNKLKSTLKDNSAKLSAAYEEELKLQTSIKGVQERIRRSGGTATAAVEAGLARRKKDLDQLRIKQKALNAEILSGNQKLKDFAAGSSGALSSLTSLAKQAKAAVLTLDLLEIGALLTIHSMVKSFQAFNAELIKASSSLELHAQMYESALAVRAATGATASQAAKAQAALAAAGLQYSESNEANLKFVTLVESSLGVSVGEAAELARQAESLGANVSAVGDSMAWLANRTDLAGDKAARVAIEVAKVARNLNLAGSALPVITAAVGAMEGQFAKLGGTEGAITKLVQRFTSLQGLGDAVLFGGNRGILDPGAFEDADKLANMVANTGRQLQQLTGGDPLRLAAMEPMLQRMGLTIGDARAIMKMSGDQGEFDKLKARMEEAKRLREETGDLEARYSEQLATSGKLFGNLWQRVRALSMTALMPLLTVINWLMQRAVDATSALTQMTSYIQKSGDATATALRTVAAAFGILASALVAGQVLKAIVGIVDALKKARAASAGGGLVEAAATRVSEAIPGRSGSRRVVHHGPVRSVAAAAARRAAPGAAAAASVIPVAGSGAAIRAAFGKIIPALSTFGAGLGTAAKTLLRTFGPWGAVAAVVIGLAKFAKGKIDEQNRISDQAKLRGMAADQAVAERYNKEVADKSLSGNSNEVSDAILLRLTRLKENGLAAGESSEVAGLIAAAQKGFARRVEVQREFVQTHPDDVQASGRFRQEQEQFAALIATLKGELGKVQTATKTGAANQVSVIGRQEALNRAQELVQESRRRAAQSPPDTYQLQRN